MKPRTLSALAVIGAAALSTACVPELTSPAGDTGAVSGWVAPENTWPTSAPPAGLVGEGYDQGDVVPDFRLMDQHGDEVSLWQFYGNVIVIDISTMWCGPCADIAEDVDETWHDYQSQGFMYLTLMPEDEVAQVPDQEDLQRWADDYGITAPVIGDDIGRAYEMAPDYAYPRIYVIDRDMRVAVERVNPADDPTIRAAIEAEL